MHTLIKAFSLFSICLINFDVVFSGRSQWLFNRKSEMSEYHPPEYCKDIGRDLSRYLTVEDFDNCAPALLPDFIRDYFLDATVRRETYRENFRAYKRLRILPKLLRDVSHVDLGTTVMGERIHIPICASPVAVQGLLSDLGEIDTVRAISESRTLMILSSYAGTTIEDVARANSKAVLWMQTYIFPDREVTINILRRAEASGYKAIVVTVDSPTEHCTESRFTIVPNPKNVTYVNLELLDGDKGAGNPKLTFKDLAWLTRQTKLPVIAKGILTAEDAVNAVRHGVAGIFVSNHGGRQLDYEPATIDVLPSIVDAVRMFRPKVEVYVDGGVRNGFDVFKALALGARMACVGRPVAWGLAVQGQKGVGKVFDILKKELNQTMTLAGTPDVNSIERKMVKNTETVDENILQNSIGSELES